MSLVIPSVAREGGRLGRHKASCMALERDNGRQDRHLLAKGPRETELGGGGSDAVVLHYTPTRTRHNGKTSKDKEQPAVAERSLALGRRQTGYDEGPRGGGTCTTSGLHGGSVLLRASFGGGPGSE